MLAFSKGKQDFAITNLLEAIRVNPYVLPPQFWRQNPILNAPEMQRDTVPSVKWRQKLNEPSFRKSIKIRKGLLDWIGNFTDPPIEAYVSKLATMDMYVAVRWGLGSNASSASYDLISLFDVNSGRCLWTHRIAFLDATELWYTTSVGVVTIKRTDDKPEYNILSIESGIQIAHMSQEYYTTVFSPYEASFNTLTLFSNAVTTVTFPEKEGETTEASVIDPFGWNLYVLRAANTHKGVTYFNSPNQFSGTTSTHADAHLERIK